VSSAGPTGVTGTRPEHPAGEADSGRLNGPGRLKSDTALLADDDGLPDEPLATYALGRGLRLSSARPSALDYLRQLWGRRHFIGGLATALNMSMYTEARLGQLWQVLTPLLNVAVYFFVFGELLHTSRGVPNYLPFLVTGVFVYNFTQRSFLIASRVMNDNLPLIRVLHFPRACLPIGYVLIELQQLVISFGVLFIIVLLTGEPLTWYWLLAIPALALQTLFNVGGGLMMARWGAGFDDVSQLMPFIMRTWMYISGVLFSINGLTLIHGSLLFKHPRLGILLQANPIAVYISLIRNAVLQSQRLSTPGAAAYNARYCLQYSSSPDNPVLKHGYYLSAYCHPVISQAGLWWLAAGWALVAIVAGYFIFWQAETRYGRG
jgi:teichoic acid transport system permease protein